MPNCCVACPRSTAGRGWVRGIIRTAALWVLCRYRHNTHWTKHDKRLARDMGRVRHGDEGYAKEELVAELGAAFLCADLAITPEVRNDHAAYIQSWLQALKDDKRLIFAAAAHAQRAVDYLHGLQARQAGGQIEEQTGEMGRAAA